jgi:hypothetical protein
MKNQRNNPDSTDRPGCENEDVCPRQLRQFFALSDVSVNTILHNNRYCYLLEQSPRTFGVCVYKLFPG